MNKYKIRDLKTDDIERLVEIDEICFPDEIVFDKDFFEYLLTDPREKAAIAITESEKIIGFIITLIFEEIAEIATIDILPEFRRKGLGKLLMEETEKRLKNKEVQMILLQVAENNTGAIEFYENLGYIKVEKIPDYYPPNISAFVMIKEVGA